MRQFRKSIANRSFLQTLRNQKLLLLFLVPGLIAVITFNYFPMVGILMAFEDYQPQLGFFGSPLVGLTHFETFLTDAKFFRALRNTLAISILYLLFGFPAPIILALMIDSVNRTSVKRLTYHSVGALLSRADQGLYLIQIVAVTVWAAPLLTRVIVFRVGGESHRLMAFAAFRILFQFRDRMTVLVHAALDHHSVASVYGHSRSVRWRQPDDQSTCVGP